jgi:enterochelin esterase family protein
VERELAVFVEEQCGIKLTSDPEGRAMMGGSSGGSAAFTGAKKRISFTPFYTKNDRFAKTGSGLKGREYSKRDARFAAAFYRPDLFRRVLTYSGTYVNQQYPFNPETPTGCWEYHGGQELIAASPKLPLRVALFNTERDNGHGLPERSYHNWCRANTRMATILKAKGYVCTLHYIYI